ncbi:MAG TPA: SRPBCC family protein [Caulobacteraceae bacterium]|nr:SRPBCC family protein [Caulobacteraceae bacterium]
MRTALIVSLLLAAAATRANAAPWEPDAGAQAQLRLGEAYTDVSAEPGDVGLIHGAIDIAATPQRVWQVMTDCRETPKLITSADPCRVLQSGPGWDVREQVTHGGFLVPTIHNVYRSDYQPYSLIRFHRVAGDLKVETGEWRLEPLNGGLGTRVIYVNEVAANILAPAALVRAGLRDDTPKVLMNLRRESTGH